MRIGQAILKFKSGNFIKQLAQKDTYLEIADFSNSLKKGSRKIRGIFVNEKEKAKKLRK
jgi:hypothetical protein